MRHFLVPICVLLITHKTQSLKYVTAIENCDNGKSYSSSGEYNYDANKRSANAKLHLTFDITPESVAKILSYHKNEDGEWEEYLDQNFGIVEQAGSLFRGAFQKIKLASSPTFDPKYMNAGDYTFTEISVNEYDYTINTDLKGEHKTYGEILDPDGNPGFCILVYSMVE